MESGWRNILKRIEPEGIPWPMTHLYNLLSGSSIFMKHYEMVASDIIKLCPAGRILDIGTGPARLLLALCRQNPDLELHGADISQAMIDRARQNCINAGKHQIELRVTSALNMPYPDDYFDAVVSTGSIHHWKEPELGLNDVYRILKPGGHALIYDLVREMPPEVIAGVRRDFGTFRLVLLTVHSLEEPFYSPGEMEKLSASTSFKEGTTSFTGALCRLTMIKN